MSGVVWRRFAGGQSPVGGQGPIGGFSLGLSGEALVGGDGHLTVTGDRARGGGDRVQTENRGVKCVREGVNGVKGVIEGVKGVREVYPQ